MEELLSDDDIENIAAPAIGKHNGQLFILGAIFAQWQFIPAYHVQFIYGSPMRMPLFALLTPPGFKSQSAFDSETKYPPRARNVLKPAVTVSEPSCIWEILLFFRPT